MGSYSTTITVVGMATFSICIGLLMFAHHRRKKRANKHRHSIEINNKLSMSEMRDIQHLIDCTHSAVQNMPGPDTLTSMDDTKETQTQKMDYTQIDIADTRNMPKYQMDTKYFSGSSSVEFEESKQIEMSEKYKNSPSIQSEHLLDKFKNEKLSNVQLTKVTKQSLDKGDKVSNLKSHFEEFAHSMNTAFMEDIEETDDGHTTKGYTPNGNKSALINHFQELAASMDASLRLYGEKKTDKTKKKRYGMNKELDQLTSMGFDRKLAFAALVQSNYNIDKAVHYIIYSEQMEKKGATRQ